MAKKDETVYYQDLEVALSDEEMNRKRDEMAAAVKKHRDVEAQKREKTATLNKELKGLAASYEALSDQIAARKEVRPVKCKRVIDPERFKVGTIRMDTGECIEIRDLTDGEAQRVREQERVQLSEDVAAAMAAFEKQIKEQADKAQASGDGKPAEEKPAAGKKAKGRGNLAAVPPPPAKEPEQKPEPPEAAAPQFSLDEITGVTKKVAARIEAAGFGTLEALRGAVPSDLTKIEGVTQALAERVLLYIEENFPMVPAGPPQRSEFSPGASAGDEDPGLERVKQEEPENLTEDSDDDLPDFMRT